MDRLIEITTVPIEIQMKVNNAKLEYARGTAQMELSREPGGLNIRSQPIRVNIDTFEARNSLTPTAMRSIEQAADKGVQSAYRATAVIAQEGQMMVEAKIGQNVIGEIARQNLIQQPPFVNVDFLPDPGAEISWDGGEMSIRYELDKLQFDWRLENTSFTFTPGDIEFTITQRPDMIVKYLGGPIYVPPSADPDYVPVDVKA